MNVINELEKSASPHHSNFLRKDQKAINQSDDVFSANKVCEGQNHPEIQTSSPFSLTWKPLGSYFNLLSLTGSCTEILCSKKCVMVIHSGIFLKPELANYKVNFLSEVST